jgi:hypothetical protein
MFNGIDLTTRTMTYDTHPGKPNKEKVTTSNTPDPPPTMVTPPSRPLQIEKHNFDSILHPPKSTNRRSTFNPNSRAAQDYNIVEDLSQSSCDMSTL